jgi:hypothetical protein
MMPHESDRSGHTGILSRYTPHTFSYREAIDVMDCNEDEGKLNPEWGRICMYVCMYGTQKQ